MSLSDSAGDPLSLDSENVPDVNCPTINEVKSHESELLCHGNIGECNSISQEVDKCSTSLSGSAKDEDEETCVTDGEEYLVGSASDVPDIVTSEENDTFTEHEVKNDLKDETSNIFSIIETNTSEFQDKCCKSPEKFKVAPNGLSESILTHPAYKTVIQELSNLKDHVKILESEVTRLECENQQLETDRSHEIYLVQLETLEKTIGQQQHEIQRLSFVNQQQSEIAAKNYQQMRDDLEGKLQKLSKQYESANADRESMVMRYVISEKEVIDLKKSQESLEKKVKESSKERDILVGKMKNITAEKSRVCQVLDTKCHELTSALREGERLKDELNSREIKIKWLQNKLKTEIDVHKETQNKLDKMFQKLQECREETEQVRRDCQDTMRAFQESEDNKAYTLGVQLKEQEAKLIMERHEKEGKEETFKQLQHEVDNLKKKNQIIIDENNVLSVKVQNLEKERLEYEQNLLKYKRTIDKQCQDVVDLQNQVAEMEALKMQMQHGQEKLTSSQAEVERLRESNEELLKEMALCREREAELLDFTQKLTEKNVRLQSEFSAIEAKAEMLELEQGPLQRRKSDLEEEVSALKLDLQKEQRQRMDENTLLARHLAERTKHAEDLAKQVEDLQGEIQVLKRKNQTTIKELTRELQHYRKKEAAHEMSSSSNSLGQASRTSSTSSLNTIGEPSRHLCNGGSKSPQESSVSNETNNTQPNLSLEPDRQMLIERIVKLQRSNARKQEKVEFLEEHAKQLVTELQKKTKIVQNYILREQVGALASDSMDQNKAEVVKHGGIMASLYGSKSMDNSMTLELSLEINKKLQAVLEDTLLKNITLKENIDTLGSEIARLTMQKNKEDINR